MRGRIDIGRRFVSNDGSVRVPLLVSQFVLGAILLVASAATARCENPSTQRAIESGRKALQGSGEFPWYDADRDMIRRVDVFPPKELAGRDSKWQKQPTNWSLPEWLAQTLEILGWLLLVLVIFAVMFVLTRAVMSDGWRAGASGTSEDPLHGDIDRIEALPFQLQHPQTDLLAEARRHYEAGRLGEAMIYLYSYQLVQLDRHQFIRLTRGKTNRQYLRELRSSRGLFDILYRSMVAFEDVFFGRHAIDRDRFENCWRGLDEFHQHLAQVSA